MERTDPPTLNDAAADLREFAADPATGTRRARGALWHAPYLDELVARPAIVAAFADAASRDALSRHDEIVAIIRRWPLPAFPPFSADQWHWLLFFATVRRAAWTWREKVTGSVEVQLRLQDPGAEDSPLLIESRWVTVPAHASRRALESRLGGGAEDLLRTLRDRARRARLQRSSDALVEVWVSEGSQPLEGAILRRAPRISTNMVVSSPSRARVHAVAAEIAKIAGWYDIWVDVGIESGKGRMPDAAARAQWWAMHHWDGQSVSEIARSQEPDLDKAEGLRERIERALRGATTREYSIPRRVFRP